MGFHRARFPVIDFHSHVSWRRAQKPRVPPAELVKTMHSPEVKDRLAGLGTDAVTSTPEEFAAYIKAEIA